MFRLPFERIISIFVIVDVERIVPLTGNKKHFNKTAFVIDDIEPGNRRTLVEE